MAKSIVPPDKPQKRPEILEKLVQKHQEEYGKKALSWMDETPVERERLTTGIPELDVCLRGGFPKGSVCEVSGLKQSGKSTLAATIAGHQNSVLYVDADRKIDSARAAIYGLTAKNCIRFQPGTQEEGWQVILDYVKVGVEIVVVDSLPSMTPSRVLNNKHMDKQAGMAMIAGFLSEKLGIINDAAFKSKTVILVVNQKRANMNVVNQYAEQYHNFGGHMLASLVAVSIDVAKKEWMKYTEKAAKGFPPYGQELAFLIAKSSVSSPRVGAVLPLVFEQGIVDRQLLPGVRQRLIASAKELPCGLQEEEEEEE